MANTVLPTLHGLNTPHGLGTLHRLMPYTPTEINIGNLAETLYPTGRAFSLSENSMFRALHDAINDSFLALINTAYDALNTAIPSDPNNFDVNDANLWEYRLGIVYNPVLTLAQRQKNILQILSFPQNILGRQNKNYIQYILNQGGFDVGIYENIFFDGEGNLYQKTPAQVFGVSAEATQFGGIAPNPTQFGPETEFGSGSYDVIANLDTASEEFNLGGILWPTFFIAGSAGINTPANIPTALATLFRQIVLKLKPAHTVALIFVNYT